MEMTSIDKTAESMSYIHSAVPLGMTDESDKKVIKGAWWMPWLTQARKDVISCGEAQIAFDPRISEWDNPGGRRPSIGNTGCRS